ncbi:MAG: hypothetical protein IPK10_07995 [Bacteroidetes bacterium]|nr:hypothetical protein [Bacteroidota bacterium]
MFISIGSVFTYGCLRFALYPAWFLIFSFANGLIFFDHNDSNEKSDSVNPSFLSTVEYHYQCYDRKWKNLLLLIGFNIYGMIVFFIIKGILHYKMPSVIFPLNNITAFFGLLIPYFFHRAYYFAIRIPELRESAYVYQEKKNEIQTNIEQVSLIAKKISSLQFIPREFDGWLFETKASFTDNEISITDKTFNIPCINQSWSYKELMDIIFYQKNQSEDHENFYKTEWDNDIKLFSGNDKLVRTCWEIYIETGSTGSGIPIQSTRITNFSVREFNEEKIEVNGLIVIKRTL